MAQRQSHSFALSVLFGAVALLSSEVAASAVSTSVFPNAACAGASAGSALVGIGRVTLSTGEVEMHCGCPSDNLPSFEACPVSSQGESVCNSILDLESGSFTASCNIVNCSGASCPKTVVNTVVVDDEDCFTSGRGALGFVTVDGVSKCSCASTAEDFTECPSTSNGRASCVSIDSDFLGMAFTDKETVKCGITCDDGFFLTPGGQCTQLAKRANVPAGASGTFHTSGPIKVGPSMSFGSSSASTTTAPGGHTSSAPHGSTSTGASSSGSSTATTTPGSATTVPGSSTATGSTSGHFGSSSRHGGHHSSHSGGHHSSHATTPGTGTSTSQVSSSTGSHGGSSHGGHKTRHSSSHGSSTGSVTTTPGQFTTSVPIKIHSTTYVPSNSYKEERSSMKSSRHASAKSHYAHSMPGTDVPGTTITITGPIKIHSATPTPASSSRSQSSHYGSHSAVYPRGVY